MNIKKMLLLVTITTTVCASLAGCNKNESDVFNSIKETKEGDFSIEFKSYDNEGNSNTIKAEGFSNSFDKPYKSEFYIYTKKNDTEYKELTKCYLYESDLYIGVPGILSKLNEQERLSEYMYLLDYSQDYLLINDTYMDKAFKLYQKNLVIPKSSRNRITTEAEIAGKVDEVTKAYDKIMKENEKERKLKETEADKQEYISFNSYLPNSFRGMIFEAINSFKTFIDTENTETKLSTGVYELNLNSEQTINVLKNIKDGAENNELVQYIAGNLQVSEYMKHLIDLTSEDTNKLLSEHLQNMIDNSNENGNINIKLSSTGLGRKKECLYIRVTTNGKNGFEFLYRNNSDVRNKKVIVPKNCLTVEDAYNKSMEIFSDEE